MFKLLTYQIVTSARDLIPDKHRRMIPLDFFRNSGKNGRTRGPPTRRAIDPGRVKSRSLL
jgi:hypothetical protein